MLMLGLPSWSQTCNGSPKFELLHAASTELGQNLISNHLKVSNSWHLQMPEFVFPPILGSHTRVAGGL